MSNEINYAAMKTFGSIKNKYDAMNYVYRKALSERVKKMGNVEVLKGN